MLCSLGLTTSPFCVHKFTNFIRSVKKFNTSEKFRVVPRLTDFIIIIIVSIFCVFLKRAICNTQVGYVRVLDLFGLFNSLKTFSSDVLETSDGMRDVAWRRALIRHREGPGLPFECVKTNGNFYFFQCHLSK